MNDTKSPFAPVDIPDLNSIPTQGAMPPMSTEGVQVQAGQGGQTGQMAQENQAAQVDQAVSQAQQQAEKATGVTMADIPEPKIETTAEAEVKKASEKDAVVNDAPAVTEAKAKEEKTEKADNVLNTKEPTRDQAQTAQNQAVQSQPMQSQPMSAGEMAGASMVAPGGVTIETLLEECIRHNASDLHLQVGLAPILRVDGELRPMTTYPVLDNEAVKQLVFSTLDENQQKILIKDKEFDYSFAFGDLGRFRVNAFHEKGNMAAAFRLIPNVIKSIEDLGIPGVVASFAERPNGLVLVTGPTGSGKSTTLAALVDKINTEKSVHIITIEDPIEFTHQSKRSVVAQREVHYDTYSFAAALRSILREDPDVVLIGEMRDLETIQAAITVAETGHLVFATLHTNSAAQSIDRMVDVFPAHQQPQVRTQLANILVGICSQRLVPAINGGRMAVAEVMVANSAVRSIIRDGKTHQLDMTIQTGAEQGMQTMDRELAKYVRSGEIAYDVAREFAVDPTEFDRLSRG